MTLILLVLKPSKKLKNFYFYFAIKNLDHLQSIFTQINGNKISFVGSIKIIAICK